MNVIMWKLDNNEIKSHQAKKRNSYIYAVGYIGVARVFDYFMREKRMNVKQMVELASGRKGPRNDFYTKTGRRLGEEGLKKARKFWGELHQEFAEEKQIIREIIPNCEGD